MGFISSLQKAALSWCLFLMNDFNLELLMNVYIVVGSVILVGTWKCLPFPFLIGMSRLGGGECHVS
jgi:hypothetical protein